MKMVGLTREIYEARKNRAYSKGQDLIQSIERFVKAHAKDESFKTDILERYEKPVQELVEHLISDHKNNKNDREAIKLLQDFWRLAYLTENYPEKDHIEDSFFNLVNCIDGINYTFSFSKEQLKEYELGQETAFYKLFDNEPDDIESSEYPLAIMLERVDIYFNIIFKKQETYDF